MKIFLLLFTILFASSLCEGSIDALSILDAKNKDVVCNGDFYFRLAPNGKPQTHFPASTMKCTVINGSLSFSGYNSSFSKSIPASINSIKMINGTMNISQTAQIPALNYLTEVKHLEFYNSKFDMLLTLKSLKMIHHALHIEQSSNVKLSFPNLVELNEFSVSQSSVTLLDFPKLTEVGLIILESSQIQSLSGFKNVNKVNGDIFIIGGSIFFFNMNSLSYIGGGLILSNLDSDNSLNIIFTNGIEIVENLDIRNNFEKSSGNINFFTTQGSTTIHGSLAIQANSGRIDLSGLKDVNIAQSIIIEDNKDKVQMYDVSKITKLQGSLSIKFNDKMVYPSFDALEYIGNDFIVPDTIKQNDNMIPNFPKLKNINGTLGIWECPGLTNLNFIHALDTFESLYIVNNTNLESLEGAENVKQLGGLNIADNMMLKSLKGLDNLVEINGAFILKDCPKISSISNLKSLNLVRSISMDFQNLKNLKSLKFGVKGSNLGYPDVVLRNYKQNKNIAMKDFKNFLKPICKNINISNTDIKCT